MPQFSRVRIMVESEKLSKKKKIDLIVHILVLFVLINGYNSMDEYKVFKSIKTILYYGLHAGYLLFFSLWLVRNWKNRDTTTQIFWKNIQGVRMPFAAKATFGAILVILMAHLIMGQTTYPFADVGMFKHASKFNFKPKVILPKYYYHDENGEVQIVDQRKEHIFFMADLLGLGYNNEYTFSSTYHYKGDKANFDFLRESIMEEAGIDTLWVGLHTVNYETGEVEFDPDLKRAVIHNDSEFVYYGSIYIPEYQKALVR